MHNSINKYFKYTYKIQKLKHIINSQENQHNLNSKVHNTCLLLKYINFVNTETNDFLFQQLKII